MNKASSIKISVFSFVCTCVIVAYHTELNCYKLLSVSASALGTLQELFEYIACIAMSFFFLKSGFLLYRNATGANIKDKLKRRLHTLLLPFLIWNIPGFLQDVFSAVILKAETDLSIGNILLKLSLFPYNGPLWYMFAILVLSCLAPMILKLKKRRIAFACAVGGAVALSVLIYGFQGLRFIFDMSDANRTYFVWTERFCRYLPCYIAGALLGMLQDERALQIKTGEKRKFMLVLVSVIISVIWIGFRESLANFYKQLFILIQPILLWLIIDEKTFDVDREPEILKTALLMYVSHYYFLRIVDVLLGSGRLHFIQAPFLYNAVVIMLPLIVCAVLCCICFILRRILIGCKMNAVLKVLTCSRS